MEELGLLREGNVYAGRYRVVMQIGRGGMGRVYLAEDTRLNGKAVALKLTKPLPEEQDAFVSEAKLMSGLSHPHLPAIVDYYPPDENGLACIVMDYVAGDTLAERFERFGLRLPFPLLLRHLLQLCDVLAYLHAQSPPIVFRDLKPSNVLIDRRGRAILVDFGIARRYRVGEQADTLRLGTPGFAAPEQLQGAQSDARTDLYTLGALAYFLLSGGRFAMSHRGDMKRALQGDVPPPFTRLLERLLADEPSLRPQTAAELRDELMLLLPEEAGAEPTEIGSMRSIDAKASGVTVVAVASAYPGAGATFAAMAASAALARAGIAHALVECPGCAGPELFARLNGDKHMPSGAVYAEGSGMQPSTPAWSKGAAVYYPIHPVAAAAPEPPGQEFARWLRGLGVPIVLLDVSSGWMESQARRWVKEAADRIWMVADCDPSKWTKRRQEACVALRRDSGRHRTPLPFDWIANREQRFPGREAWLNLFPARPAALLPQLDSEAMLTALWRGQGLPDDGRTSERLDASLERLLVRLVEGEG